MILNDFDYLLDLPGEEREQCWLQERLETLSVREGIVLAAAAQSDPPGDMAQAINCLMLLDYYPVRINAGSYEALGMDYLRRDTSMPESALPYVDLAQTEKYYENMAPGLFVGNCYVEYPNPDLVPCYCGQGMPLPTDDDWSVRLKVASPAVPEGVWMRFPGPFLDDFEGTVEEALALQELRVKRWDECALLDARCILPEVEDLMEQYDNVADLIYDGIELGYVLSQKGQGMPCFMERYAAALKLEDCHSLKLALDISQNLRCYDWASCTSLEDSAKELLLKKGVSETLIRASGIDLAGYQAHLLEEKGYTLTPDEGVYIRRNDEEFHYCYSTPTPEQSGMTMQ